MSRPNPTPPLYEGQHLSSTTIILIGSALVLLAIGAQVAGFGHWLSVQTILAERETLQAWVSGHHALAALGFVAVHVAVAALAIPGTAILSLLGGFLFGRWFGTVLVLIGATAGGLVVFLVARSALGEPLRRRAGPLYGKISTGMHENAVEILLFMRLVPLFPFFLVTIAAALFDIRIATFVLTTAIGIAPAVFIYNSVGRELGAVSSLGSLLSPETILALLGLAGLSLLPILFKRRMRAPKTPDRDK